MKTRFSRWIFAWLLAVMLTSTLRAADASHPNILFILADQWRAQAFGFAGDPNVKTPHLDRFAGMAVRFTQAVAGMPVCCPTRASLLTGQRPLTHGVFMNDVPLPNRAVTIAEVLAATGYHTGFIGKWHLNGDGRSVFIPPERRQGFQYWRALECTHNYNHSFYYGDSPERRIWEGYDAVAQTRDACAYLRQHAKDPQPVFLVLAWGPPHNPYQTAPEKYRALYDPEQLQLRPNVPESMRASVRKNLAGYYAHCSALDDCAGELLTTLRETGLARDTIVVFTSDHGDLLGSHGAYRKQQPYEEAVRVPLLIRWPHGLGEDGKEFDAPINSEDVMPTLLGLAGGPIPAGVEGLDYSGYLKGGRNPSDGATLLSCAAPFGEWSRKAGGREYRGVRTARYTYMRDLHGPWLLFDNATDPYQQHNIVGLAESRNLQEQLDQRLRTKLRETGDAFRPAADYIQKWGYTVDANGTVPYTP